MKKVLVLGATGLVGTEILKQLEASSEVLKINVLLRRPLPQGLKNSKVQEYVMDFDRLDSSSDCFSVDAVICAIGTTIKKAGSQEAFRQVDYEYPLKIAKFCKAKGAQGFYLVSALGADANSPIFYNRVKGELERDLQKIGFANLVIAHPSVLLGNRQESRPAEKIAMQVGKLFPKKWRSVPAEKVAHSLVASLKDSKPGTRVFENSEILNF